MVQLTRSIVRNVRNYSNQEDNSLCFTAYFSVCRRSMPPTNISQSKNNTEADTVENLSFLLSTSRTQLVLCASAVVTCSASSANRSEALVSNDNGRNV